MSESLEVSCAAVRRVARAAAIFTFLISLPLMFLDSIFELFLLVLQGIVTLVFPMMPTVMNHVLGTARGSLW